ncbi:putative sugar kinase YdjH [Variibacter gotjawalensis]|uniref:Putative sugar kinase YdjH n=1 Tax=Variibacter gotjawalensis TaxID=1333996 RepID=A0A0S3Q182_9BRAD|nr:PfkB family carbohydrate kinase [Variibacter gotjawalensis]NIK47768.1 sulfofructose kinase [Variibacter gotjawalensis]RZS49655.1 sulfofructose kinase [Variibacter gotjawalensis]BAT61921.1 putative sugar kinase YdjH [Variibacter gotjawalensis]
MTRIVCVGNGVLDQVYEVDALPRAGVKTTALAFREGGGGPAATAAIAIARLGGNAAWWGRIGDDSAGTFISGALGDAGVDLSGLAVLPGARTVRAAVIVDRTGERSILVDRSGLPTDASVLPYDNLSDEPVMLADSRWPEGSEAALRRASELGLTRVFDADGGNVDMLGRLARLADHIVFSQEGLRDLVGEGEPEEQLRRAAERFDGVLAVTCGGSGSLWWIDGTITRVGAFPVQVRDTTGCGDVFHGAYALGLAEAMPPLEAARFASAVAAMKAANGNGWNGTPDRASVEQLMKMETDR